LVFYLDTLPDLVYHNAVTFYWYFHQQATSKTGSKMKTLLLMRHAKSSWKNMDLSDFERPLKKRGRRDTQAIRELLQQENYFPEQIVCSAAQRALQTVEQLTEDTEIPGGIFYSNALYLAEMDEIIEIVQGFDDAYDTGMIVGHNPGLECLVQILSSEIEALPTAAVAIIELEIDRWKELDDETDGKLAELWRPRKQVKHG
jgi:phosphohistidine phosphatase